MQVVLTGPENVREAGWDDLADVLKLPPGIAWYVYIHATGTILTVAVFLGGCST